MKVDLNITKWFLDFDLPSVDELVKKVGAQLGAVEEVINIGEKYKEIFIVKVESCQKHPDADKLSICLIDDGGKAKGVNRDSKGLVQVVCGAPNVHEGMLAVWLPPGTTVPSTIGKDPLVLESRELRGSVSNGMLASPKELDIGDSHSGLLEIENDIKPGSDFAEAFGRKDDFVIDIENKMFTHRPDCFGFMGVARELAGIYQKPFKGLEWYVQNPEFPKPEADRLELTLTNELPDLVPRFTMAILSDVHVGASPLWLQDGLSRLGQKSINNIVDYTNWYMLETGQPLHAYDYDKVKKLSGDQATIVVRNPKPGEKIKLLNGKEIEPRAEAIMIATDKQLIGVGGVMGGTDTEVDENTKNIILECANFDMYSIRRTSMAHGLFTDAVTRFTKGQSPLQNLAVLGRITKEIREHDGGKIASPIIDNNHVGTSVLERGSMYEPVKVSADFINVRLGLELPVAEMKKLLENVEFKVEVNGGELTVIAPFWRTDIELREDVVEEIGRLYGYDHLPLTLPKRDLLPAPRDALLELKSKIRIRLAKAGANEVLTYSFVHGDLLEKVGQDKSQAFQISNALSPDLQYYRLSLTPSLLEKIHPNIKAGYDRFAIFEIGKVQSATELDETGLPKDFGRVALVFAANKKAAQDAGTGAPYFQARELATHLLNLSNRLNFVRLSEVNTGPHKLFAEMLKPYDPSRSAVIYQGERILGVVGEYRASIRRSLKLPNSCAGFELFLSAFAAQKDGSYNPLPRFPKVMQDITLKVPADLAYQELYDFVSGELAKAQPKNTLPELGQLDIFQREEDKDHKQVTFRLKIASYDRTLTDPEVNKLLDTIAAAANTKFGAERV